MFARKIRGLAEQIPADPHDATVEDLRKSYPYSDEAFGVRSMIRLTVYVVMEMKKRGLI
jgi:hypothetical protein